MDYKIRRRSRLKRKQAIQLKTQLQSVFGECEFWDDNAAVETADFADQGIFIVDQQILGMMSETPFLSVRGVLKYRPTTRYVTVDMGAVKFVHNGADVMAPGITAADPALQEGDWCWIRDEKNHQPLGIGICMVAGTAMVGASGKAVKSVHHIGDKLWEI